MNRQIEYLVDDTPLDVEKFMEEHTKEEIEKMYQEHFGIEQDRNNKSEE